MGSESTSSPVNGSLDRMSKSRVMILSLLFAAAAIPVIVLNREGLSSTYGYFFGRNLTLFYKAPITLPTFFCILCGLSFIWLRYSPVFSKWIEALLVVMEWRGTEAAFPRTQALHHHGIGALWFLLSVLLMGSNLIKLNPLWKGLPLTLLAVGGALLVAMAVYLVALYSGMELLGYAREQRMKRRAEANISERVEGIQDRILGGQVPWRLVALEWFAGGLVIGGVLGVLSGHGWLGLGLWPVFGFVVVVVTQAARDIVRRPLQRPGTWEAGISLRRRLGPLLVGSSVVVILSAVLQAASGMRSVLYSFWGWQLWWMSGGVVVWLLISFWLGSILVLRDLRHWQKSAARPAPAIAQSLLSDEAQSATPIFCPNDLPSAQLLQAIRTQNPDEICAALRDPSPWPTSDMLEATAQFWVQSLAALDRSRRQAFLSLPAGRLFDDPHPSLPALLTMVEQHPSPGLEPWVLSCLKNPAYLSHSPYANALISALGAVGSMAGLAELRAIIADTLHSTDTDTARLAAVRILERNGANTDGNLALVTPSERGALSITSPD